MPLGAPSAPARGAVLVEQRLGYQFVERALFERALTHRSFGADHNERLEFLGDAVLNLAVSRLLFDRFSGSDEGDLTRVRAHLVREDSLHKVALVLGLPDALKLSEGEARGGGAARPSILADAVEALIGAVSIDGGFEAAQALVKRLFGETIMSTTTDNWRKDAKTELQEWLQARHVPVPAYRIAATRGQAHAQTFEVECDVPALKWRATGVGKSRRAAEQASAQQLLDRINAGELDVPTRKETLVPEIKPPHDSSDELSDDESPQGEDAGDELEDFADDGQTNETPLSEAAIAAMLSAAVDENGEKKRCGLVAIVGRPNVGKSTLLNALVGQKISITSNKAQTTRHRITGVRSDGPSQFVFVDTPGYQTKHSAALNKSLNKTVVSVLTDVDIVLFMVEAGKFGADDAKALQLMPRGKPVILIPNKLDQVQRRSDLLPWLKSMQDKFAFAEFFPMSAYSTGDIDRLLGVLRPYLPEQPWFYDAQMLTDRSERFLVSEVIREKLFRLTGDELPYNVTVVIDQFVEEGAMRRIAATIIVERDAHKGMVIGAKGLQLKRIASESRQELERLLEAKVFLEVWVKVRSGWADSEEHLRSYGYE